MLLRFRRHNTADQGSDEVSERPRRGIDTGNHYELFGGTLTIGAMSATFCIAGLGSYTAGLTGQRAVCSLIAHMFHTLEEAQSRHISACRLRPDQLI